MKVKVSILTLVTVGGAWLANDPTSIASSEAHADPFVEESPDPCEPDPQRVSSIQSKIATLPSATDPVTAAIRAAAATNRANWIQYDTFRYNYALAIANNGGDPDLSQTLSIEVKTPLEDLKHSWQMIIANYPPDPPFTFQAYDDQKRDPYLAKRNEVIMHYQTALDALNSVPCPDWETADVSEEAGDNLASELDNDYQVLVGFAGEYSAANTDIAATLADIYSWILTIRQELEDRGWIP